MGFDLVVSLRLLSEAALQTDEEVSLKLKIKMWTQNVDLRIIKIVTEAIGIDEAIAGQLEEKQPLRSHGLEENQHQKKAQKVQKKVRKKTDYGGI